jgi:UDP-glucose 4-epimerase
MRAVIIGSNGYLGRHIAKYCDANGYELRLYDIQESSTDGRTGYSKIDLQDKNCFDQIDLSCDLIFFFSGITGTAAGFKNYSDFIDVNEKGLLALLEKMRADKSPARIIFPSTRLVYKGRKDVALDEEAEKELKTIYAINKFSCEAMLKMYNNCFGLDYSIFRICVPYGNELDDNYSYGTIGSFLSRASKGENIQLYGDGLQKRSFIHVSDLAAMILESAGKPGFKNGTFNLGGPDTYSIREVAEMIASQFNVKVVFVPWPELDLALESGDTIFDSSKLEKLLAHKYRFRFSSWIGSVHKRDSGK